MTVPTALGQLLQQRRLQLGYSRARAGELAELRPSTIESWELGRVSKPPIHDVLRLARTLQISTADLERAVLPDDVLSQIDAPDPPPSRAPLLDQTMSTLGWSENDAAAALNTSPTRIRALRRGEDDLSVLDVMTLAALSAAFRGAGGPVSAADVRETLAQLRRSPT